MAREMRFVFDEISENTRFDYQDILYYTTVAWFQIAEGPNKRNPISFPLEHPEYSDEMEAELEQITELSSKDQVVLQFKQINTGKYLITKIVSVNDL